MLQRRREAMLLDLGALVLEMHRHRRFLPDSLQRRAAEAVGTDAELRVLSRTLQAGDGDPDLVAAGVAGNCDRCGALHTLGAAFCSQCGNELETAGVLPRKAALGADPALAGGAPVPRRPVAAAPAVPAVPTAEAAGDSDEEPAETDVLAPAEDQEAEHEEAEDDTHEEAVGNGGPAPPHPIARRARAARVRQRLDEPARGTPPLPTGLLAGIAAGAVVIVVGILLLSSGDGAEEPERAADTPAEREPEPAPPDEAPAAPERADRDSASTPAALEPLEGVTATDYDPSGDDQEHGAEAPLAVDGDGSTVWPTEEYEAGALQKDGVGLTLAPARPVAARGLDLITPTPGFDVTIYGAEGGSPPESLDGWTQIASADAVPSRNRIDLDAAGSEFSHYLVWITTLPEGEGRVEIAESRLLR